MTGTAIVMMVATLGIICGGLAFATSNLIRHPDDTSSDVE